MEVIRLWRFEMDHDDRACLPVYIPDTTSMELPVSPGDKEHASDVLEQFKTCLHPCPQVFKQGNGCVNNRNKRATCSNRNNQLKY